MIRTLAFLTCFVPFAAFALSAMKPPPGMDLAHHMPPGQHMMHGRPTAAAVPTQPGQSAFAAIQEIVEILAADPKTDWTKVNIDALRQHLVDMNNVTLAAIVKSGPVDGGVRFNVTGEGLVHDSIRRMTAAHAATMNGVEGWRFEFAEIEGGAALTVHTPAKDVDKLRGLGLFGVLALGMHHQEHHLMIARGENPHG